MSSLDVDAPFLLGRGASRCTHLRQRHPLQEETLLLCAWPGCPEGTRNASIQYSIRDGVGGPAVNVRLERSSEQHGARLSFRWRTP